MIIDFDLVKKNYPKLLKAMNLTQILEILKECEVKSDSENNIVMTSERVENILKNIYSELVEEYFEMRTISNIKRIFKQETDFYKLKIFKE